ncbi:MAG: SDR family oxidoreductase [Mycobacteriales bacterium]
MTTASAAQGRRTALVTGGGSGVGRAIATALAAAGFAVAVTGRRRGFLDETAEVLGPGSLVLVGDVASEADVVAAFEQVRTAWGRLDVLVNNAGTGAPAADLPDVPADRFAEVMATNVLGTFLCTREAMRLMRAQTPHGGRIINNGSISAHRPRPGSAAYTASKHAVAGLAKQTELDGRKYGISCCQLDIGNAGTDMTSRMSAGVPQADGSMRAEPTFDVAEVGRLVAHIATLPPGVTISDVTILAAGMPYVGRG